METKNLIQASANVIKITALKIGDVVKYVDSSYGSNEIKYGVVLDLLNDGEKSYIQILLYSTGYSDLKSEIKVFEGKKDISIFPATVDEVKDYMETAIDTMKRKIEESEKELNQKKIGLQKAIEFVSMETSRELTEVNYKEVSQVEYNEIKTKGVF